MTGGGSKLAMGGLALIGLLGGCDESSPACPDGGEGTWQGDVLTPHDALLVEGACAARIEGSVRLDRTDAQTLSRLGSVREISRDLLLTIDDSELDLSGLAALEEVGRDLRVVVPPNGPRALDGPLALPRLHTVGRDLKLDSPLSNQRPLDLSSLVAVQGDLWIIGGVRMAGALGSLERVEGELRIEGADSVESLGALEHVGGRLRLADLGGRTLEPLSSLRTVRRLDVEGADALTDLRGLGSVRGLPDGLRVVACARLERLSGLGLDGPRVGSIELTDLVSLRSIAGLAGIEVVDDDVAIQRNRLLDSLDGLQDLREVGGAVALSSNALIDTSALAGLERAGSVSVSQEAELRALELGDELVELDELQIADNAVLERIDGVGSVPSLVELRVQRNPSLTSLPALSSLEQVDGMVLIEHNYALRSLTGLEALARTELLSLTENTSLQSVDSLAGLQEMDGILSISGSPEITGDQGLASLTRTYGVRLQGGAWTRVPLPALRTTGVLTLQSMHGLTDLRGLEQVQTLHQLTVMDNDALQSLAGADALHTVEVLHVQTNPSLEGLDGLPALTSAREITVSNNTSLVKLRFLSSITGEVDRLWITHNPRLLDLDGLSGITGVADDVRLRENTSLGDEAAWDFVDGLRRQPSTISVHGN